MNSNVYKYSFVYIILLLVLFSQAHGHIGEPCTWLFFCKGENTHCDGGLCRCKKGYPIIVDEHTCKKGSQHGTTCDDTKECTFFDENSYCTQTPKNSICQCHSGFRYNETKQLCLKLEKVPRESFYSALPTIIGATVGICIVFSICVCFFRMRQRNEVFSRAETVHDNGTTHIETTPSAPESSHEIDSSLPLYEAVVAEMPLKDIPDEPPPSYEEIMLSSKTNSKLS